MFQILNKQLDESTFCPLCQASMYFIEAEQFGQEFQLHECSHCKHQVFQEDKHNCHCEKCQDKRKKLLKEARLQEHQQFRKKKDIVETSLEQLSFLNKLFLLSLLDAHVNENSPHEEYIDWAKIKYHPISPHYFFQNYLFERLIKDQVLIPKDFSDDMHQYYINTRLDGYSEPSLFSITHQLRLWFFENLRYGVPFHSADEVKDTLYLVLYQEIIQFTASYCRTWNIQFAGNKAFRAFCYGLMESLAVGQIYYLIQTALEYLYQQKALQARNENFINTNILRKTVEQYYERAKRECWETSILPRPLNLPISQMSQIFLFRFLGYDESIFFQPLWRLWKKIEPRLNFYSKKRCMYCGSNDLSVEYDAQEYVSLTCRQCKHQDHYFTQ